MTTTVPAIDAIAASLGELIDVCNSLREHAEIMFHAALQKSYDSAWTEYAACSIEMHHYMTLDNLLKTGDETQAANFIRFTLQQIRKYTDADRLDSSESVSDAVLTARRRIYQAFSRYLGYFD